MIILKWNPYSTNNIYCRNWHKWYMKSWPRQLKDSYIIQARQQVKQKLEWDVRLEIKIYFWTKRKNDIDNFHKLSLDSLSWILYDDDSQIMQLNLYKYYDKLNPRLEITIL